MTETASRPKPARRASPDDPVAGRIRQRRLGLGWSFKRLSEATSGLAPSFLFNIECGRKVPSEDVAARIAHALEDGAFEATYRAWARAKSRGRTGRMDHEAMLRAWEQLRNPFGSPPPAARSVSAPPATGPGATVRDGSRLRIPVLATPRDPGDGVRPLPEMIINTLSLDPGLWGHDSGLARERFERLRRPFAFPLEEPQAASVSLPGGYLAIVTREPVGEPAPRAVYVLHWNDRLELARGVTLAGGPIPETLRRAGLESASQILAAVIGRIDLLLPDVRS
ncbi:MAG: helix-turn-helix transcriptional regulator [Candidatus Eisenbacteria bacterium]|nr:helix-turn-helix transcriptional regulator [Candidatus Eisenbacteria bacterium]